MKYYCKHYKYLCKYTENKDLFSSMKTIYGRVPKTDVFIVKIVESYQWKDFLFDGFR